MATYYISPKDDPEAAWAAQVNYLAQLCDEQSLVDQVPAGGESSEELAALNAQYRRLAGMGPAEYAARLGLKVVRCAACGAAWLPEEPQCEPCARRTSADEAALRYGG